jgi:catechol 2,3-dioxygenase-like lactoylglutathione lyase family enzyme
VIPAGRLHHVSVVVRDLEATARWYATIHGVERWDVARYAADRLRDTSAFGFEASYTYATATGTTPRGITFRLVQPTGGMSTYAEFLATRGEGIHGLCLATIEAPAFRELALRLREEGVPVAQSATVDGVAAHHHLDTRAALGGWYVEVVVPAAPGGPWNTRVDERWDFRGAARPPGVEALQEIPRIWHFGVAVRDLMGRLPSYARLLGLHDWRFVHFRPEPGSLEASTLDGAPVRHAFLLAMADLPAFGLELIQPTVEPTHYRRELLDPIGEGIHHVLAAPSLSESEWAAVRAWMESLDVPVAMSGRVRSGTAEFFYLDSRPKLGGYLLEVIRRSTPPDGGEAPRSEPDFRFDFSKRAAL